MPFVESEFERAVCIFTQLLETLILNEGGGLIALDAKLQEFYMRNKSEDLQVHLVVKIFDEYSRRQWGTP